MTEKCEGFHSETSNIWGIFLVVCSSCNFPAKDSANRSALIAPAGKKINAFFIEGVCHQTRPQPPTSGNGARTASRCGKRDHYAMKQFCYALILCLFALPVRLLAQEAPASPVAAERMAREVAALTNAERAAVGLPPLKLQDNLQVSARWLAADMAEKNYFSHTDKQGRDIDPRLPSCGYRRYHAIGENIAAGQASPTDAVAEWMKSPGHRNNILSRDWNEIGIGYSFSNDSKFQRYWVQDFGSRYNVFPVIINGEQPDTKTPLVHLYLYGAGWAQQMRLSNDGKNWTPWEPYVPVRDWNLAEGSGLRAVYAEVKNSDGVIHRDQDTINLLPQSASKN